jgi:hypothetical protein
MTDEMAQLLKSLHLARVAEILDEELANAEKASLSYQELLVRRKPSVIDVGDAS